MKAATGAPGLRRLGWTSTCAGALALVAVAAGWPRVLAWAARHLSRDHQITSAGEAQLAVLLVAACAALPVAGWVLARLAQSPHRLQRLFADAGAGGARVPSYRTLACGWAAAAGAVAAVAVWGSDPRVSGETGLVETVQVAVLLAAALALGHAAATMGLRSGRGLAHAALAAAALAVAGEEVSWGQWYFGWPTPAGWAALNSQGETNVHNLFNVTFGSAYVLLGVGAVVYLVASTVVLAAGRGGGGLGWLVLRPNASGAVAAIATGLLLARLGSSPQWLELEELAAYLLLLLWAHDNRRAATIAPCRAPTAAHFASAALPPSPSSSPP